MINDFIHSEVPNCTPMCIFFEAVNWVRYEGQSAEISLIQNAF